MEITFLGHAAFISEGSNAIIVMDPWLSASGAFDSAWFQYPSNHHLAEHVRQKLQTNGKEKYIYISHEHKDHYDMEFLKSLGTDDFTFIIGAFRRTVLADSLSQLPSKKVIVCKDRQRIDIPGGELTLFLDDTELNRDSAVFLKLDGHSFLNFNDCRKLDEIPNIKQEYNTINVFACQFSGATWHPTCYEYSRRNYELISLKKTMNKFETVAKAIEAADPEIYIPSAGPPCFLDPDLYHINFEKINIFPKQWKFISYLQKRLKTVKPVIADMMPGDVIDSSRQKFTHLAETRVNEDNSEQYLNNYYMSYKNYFDAMKGKPAKSDFSGILSLLKKELEEKLNSLTIANRIMAPLYFKLNGHDIMLKVDFMNKKIETANHIAEKDHYSISAPAWEVKRVLERKITWDDFSLTFRMRLNREPDMYQKIIEAFLVLEKEDINGYCSKLLEIESMTERVIIEAGGVRYSINRFCPHEGGDLSKGWVEENRYLVCPRHSWKYDLMNEGKCTSSTATINAICLEND